MAIVLDKSRWDSEARLRPVLSACNESGQTASRRDGKTTRGDGEKDAIRQVADFEQVAVRVPVERQRQTIDDAIGGVSTGYQVVITCLAG